MASFDLTWGLTIFGILKFFALAGGEMFLFEVTDSEFEESVSDELLMSGTSSLGLLRPVKKEISVHFFFGSRKQRKKGLQQKRRTPLFLGINKIKGHSQFSEKPIFFVFSCFFGRKQKLWIAIFPIP